MRRMSVMHISLHNVGALGASSLTKNSCDLSANTEGLTGFIANLETKKDGEQPPSQPMRGPSTQNVAKLDDMTNVLFAQSEEFTLQTTEKRRS